MKDKKKDQTTNLFNKHKDPLQLNILGFFSIEKQFLPRSDGELIEQPFACSVRTTCTDSNENQISSPYYGVWDGQL